MFVRTTNHTSPTSSTTPSGTTLERTGRWAQEKGASLVEYALLVALIAVVCISAVAFLGTSSSDKVGDAGTAVQDGAGGASPTTAPEIICPPGFVAATDGGGNPYCVPA